MNIGFTGTREGMTDEQQDALSTLISVIDPDHFHHGDCVGADEQAHNIVDRLRHSILIHPPSDNKLRAFCGGAVYTFKPRPYIERNHNLVDHTTMLLAAPKGFNEEKRSGTWATIRYAMKCNRTVGIIWPDGKMEFM